ncbi:MAG TPA: ATPase domain-containing protein [Candidatus Kapabacteria bacterium]|nr:ATPase domain-containing protein [Candidatus Kapabacteria bacterium]
MNSNTAAARAATPETGQKVCKTGVQGMDHILGGGLPAHRMYLLEGDPGVGKTTFALQFLMEGVKQGESGLYITLSETKEELQGVAKSHGWSLDGFDVFELSAIEQQLQDVSETTFYQPSELELNRTTKVLTDEVDRLKPARVVFDSLSELRLLAETPLRHRRQILSLKQFFGGRHCTVLLLDDRTTSTNRDAQVQSIAHGVISLEKNSPAYGVARRTLNVVKLRGVAFKEGYHDLVINPGGVVIFPRLVAAEHRGNFVKEIFKSGIAGLDALLGGGLHRGTSTMLMGPPGTGKSSLSLKYAWEAAKRGEVVNLFIFDETLGTLIDRGTAMGMDVRPHLESGRMRVDEIDPAEISPGELMSRIREAVEERDARMIVIDSVNGYLNAMPEERFLSLQLHELLSYLNHKGVITLMVLAQQGLVGSMQSPVDLTYLADGVVMLRYFEAEGQVKQAISVIKKRSGQHERNLREYCLDERGIHVGEPLKKFHGVLTGTPTVREVAKNGH